MPQKTGTEYHLNKAQKGRKRHANINGTLVCSVHSTQCTTTL